MSRKPTRRSFLKLSAAAASVSAAKVAHGLAPSGGRIAIITDDSSPLILSEPVQWALEQLRDAITPARIASDHSAAFHVHIAPPGSELTLPFKSVPAISQPESVALIPGVHMNTPAVLVTGMDARGIVYGLLELADRVRSASDPVLALHLAEPIVETTPNRVRSISRAFCSEVEDKPWFYDRAFWTNYLDTVVAARFNRFALTFGLAYDFPRGVTDDYFHLPYPYLVNLSAYPQVHIEPALEEGERRRNLDTLSFIASETARRGLEFQLGIWTHAYQWTDSPNSHHHIVGLTPENHAAYCRDALAEILRLCPQITGLTMRIHGESGIPEGSYGFWQTLWEAVTNARTPDGKPRVIELDLHAKGLDQRTIEVARATGMPVKAGAKYWAEHLGLGYQQADIRATEYPKQGVTGTFAVSAGARNFTRYGYGDFYQKNLGVELLYRVWPGTQRHLLWADPALASGYGRAANFCGAAGMELMEPLFFKGREGSGHPGGRDAYADSSLAPAALDSRKFSFTCITWGRHLYNPDADPGFYHRALESAFGPAGPALETALAASSRILPIITTAWCPSASNHDFWPEMLTSVQLLPYTKRPLYGDSPAPHNVSAISPLDPQLFTTVAQHTESLATDTRDARYNTSEVIASLESLVTTSSNALAKARTTAGTKARTPEFRRAEEDILILNGLGTYYADLLRAGLFYSIHEKTQDPAAAVHCLTAYRKARATWAAFSERAKSIYVADVSYGEPRQRRGHWIDRLPAIDTDLQAVEQQLNAASSASIPQPATQRALHPSPRPTITVRHVPVASFHPGSELALSVTAPSTVTEAVLWYRHVSHGERWRSMPMQRSGALHTAAIPGDYTNSPFPLQYYFELRTASAAVLHPPFNSTWSNQPYFAIHNRT